MQTILAGLPQPLHLQAFRHHWLLVNQPQLDGRHDVAVLVR